MELSFKTMIVSALAVLVLISFIFFFSSQSGEQLTQAQANRIFYDLCSDYRESNCDWTVTYEERYSDYMNACRVLFQQEAGRYSCLYRFCCEQTKNVLCSGLCHACEANDEIKTSTAVCCTRYRAECGDIECGACE